MHEFLISYSHTEWYLFFVHILCSWQKSRNTCAQGNLIKLNISFVPSFFQYSLLFLPSSLTILFHFCLEKRTKTIISHSFCSFSRVFEKTLVHEFISYSHTEWYLFFSPQCKECAMFIRSQKIRNTFTFAIVNLYL